MSDSPETRLCDVVVPEGIEWNPGVRVALVAPSSAEPRGGQEKYGRVLTTFAWRSVELHGLRIPHWSVGYPARWGHTVMLAWGIRQEVRRGASVVHIFASCTLRGLLEKLLFSSIARAAGARVIFNLRSALDTRYESWPAPVQRFVRRALRAQDIVLCQHQQLADFCHEELGIPTSRLHVIPNSVATDETGATYVRSRRGGRSLRVLFMGRFTASKGISDILEIMKHLQYRQPGRFRFRLVGAGRAKDRIRLLSRLASSGLDEIATVNDHLDGPGRNEAFRDSDCLLLPSYVEGFPNIVLESMLAGLPPVAYRVGGIGDAVRDGIDGFLLSPGDWLGIAERLCLLEADRDLLARMGAAAAVQVRSSYQHEQVLPRLERLYRAVAAQRADARSWVTTPAQ